MSHNSIGLSTLGVRSPTVSGVVAVRFPVHHDLQVRAKGMGQDIRCITRPRKYGMSTGSSSTQHGMYLWFPEPSMYLPRHSMIGVWEGMKLLAVKTFRPLPRSDTLHLMGFNLLFWKAAKENKDIKNNGYLAVNECECWEKNNRKSWIELVQNTNEQLGLKLWARRH